MSELIGMKSICQAVQRSESTVLIWIRDMDFPAKKIGGIWESSTEAIAKWKEKVFEGKIDTRVKRKKGRSGDPFYVENQKARVKKGRW